ncbi:ABC transporter ATP-binding protein [Actinomadura verrucosospora]|uniref:ABC transporter ATP-binding protein n=1 Tax=Actinomadura verrucosospora TaxID=46165 RepID=A0A7D3ZJX2_ACTVE|nr:ABC transporter ATP-binding protein [Actinomadura verrucosospora]QKG20142.1 ABC transporter ATP-binding protein [Actinomadura verrucosospora]
MTPVISMSGVEKSFGQTRALDQLDLSVEPGEVHGFLGPNGAGKTTTIRILLGLLHADAGQIRVLGGDPWTDATELHRQLAYVPGDVNLWPGLTGGETIDLIARMRGGIDPRRRADLIERFDLDPKKKARTYSKGNRQKVTLIAALASEVELLVLDEPTSGLDPLMEETFRQVVGEEARNGRTVLLSSHILSEVEALCNRITIIREGRTVETGSIQDMHHLSRTSITARLTGEVPRDLPGAHEVHVADGQIRCEVDTDRLNEVLGRLIAVGVQNLVAQPPTLEELFLRYYVDRPAAGADASTTHSGARSGSVR